ncbi:MAG: DUF1887 family CARF protein [Methanomicrobiales archaeon]|nr:DUF1887 family CARF protein [Methanomicrobiales archaeon]MDI6876067.1 DUF1887 family CARF protein [Methanomicrobiales archaeon]
MKILVNLISQQHVPNLLVVHAIKPDRLVLVTTKAKEKNMDYLLNALETGGLDYKKRHKQLVIERENNAREVREGLERLYQSKPNEEWIVHISGGTKPMSIGAYEFARNHGLRAWYVSEWDQTMALDLLSESTLSLDHRMSAREFLQGYGFDITNGGVKETPEKWDLALYLASNCHNPSVQNVLSTLQKLKNDKKPIELDQLSKDLDVPGDLRTRMEVMSNVERKGTRVGGKLSNKDVEFLTGGWLEYFVFQLLKAYEGKGIWDLNFRMHLKEGGDTPNSINEWDVTFMRDQMLCIVECKTGEQEHDPKGNDTLYKIEATKSQLSAIRVSTFLCTTSNNILETESAIRKHIKRRAELYKCDIVPRNAIMEWATCCLQRDAEKLDRSIRETFRIRGGNGS